MEWLIRIGIHTGEVVAGIVGTRKYIYDVFGDTINTASRMETNGEPMKINISESTFSCLIKNYQQSEIPYLIFERKSLPIKGKGECKMYFLGRK